MIDVIFEQMDLERVDDNLFRGYAQDHGEGRVFGGQVVGQALIAASRTVEGRPCHSLKTYFLRPGDPKIPIDFQVDRLRDGRSFAVRHVNAIQNGVIIFRLTASFQSLETGIMHQIDMPNVPFPEDLPHQSEHYNRILKDHPDVNENFVKMVYGQKPVEFRHVEDFSYFKPKKESPIRHIWHRSVKPIGDDLLKHQSLLAYASDIGFISTSNMPHGKSFMTGLTLVSIDHSMWFHRPFSMDDWILIAMESTVSVNSRAFVRASMFTRDGTLIGSATQEGLIREKVI